MLRAAIALSLVVLSACGVGDAGGDDGDVVVRGAWARPTPLATSPAAVYFEIEVAEDDVLVGASAPTVAAVAEVHESVTQDGAMSMHETHGVELAAGEPVRFEPGGLHVMLVDLRTPLEAGQRFDLTLTLDRAGDVVTEVDVRE
jgi:copper(I)-binding protein